MENKNSLNKRWKNVSILFVIFLVVIFAQDITREIVILNQETILIEEELNRDIHIESKNNTKLITDDFNYIIENLTEELVLHSQENLESLYFAAKTFESMNETMTDEDLIEGVSHITSLYDLNDENHDYYVLDLDGYMHYNGKIDSVVSVDMNSVEDYFGTLYIEEFIEGFDLNDSFLISYYDLNEGIVNNYILFGRQIENSSLIIVNEVNLNDFSNEMKLETLQGIDEKYGNTIRDIFILDTEGRLLYHRNSDYIGQNLNTSDSVITTFLSQITNFISDNTNGFIETNMYGVDNQIQENVSFIELIDEWDLIVGSNVSKEKYNEIIDQYKNANYQQVLYIKIPSYVIIVILSIVIYNYLNKTIKKSQLVGAEDEKLYRKFANLTSEIILITDKQGEITYANNLGMTTIFGKRDITAKIFFDQIFVEEEGFFILYGYTEDYFVKFITETIEYKNEKADLYIITDVTEKIKTERKLEALSLVDDLTKLGNRRMMVREYNDIVLPYVKNGKPAFLVMLDLDDFKPANDLYGHSYGDKVLVQIASIFNEYKTDDLLIYRIGGDEFALVFLDNSKDNIIDRLKLIQKHIEDYPYDKDINVSFSAGITEMKVNDKRRRFSDYYDRADKLLYQAKKEGKSKIYF